MSTGSPGGLFSETESREFGNFLDFVDHSVDTEMKFGGIPGLPSPPSRRWTNAELEVGGGIMSGSGSGSGSGGGGYNPNEPYLDHGRGSGRTGYSVPQSYPTLAGAVYPSLLPLPTRPPSYPSFSAPSTTNGFPIPPSSSAPSAFGSRGSNSIEDERLKQERLAQQTRDLENWMRERGLQSLHSSTSTSTSKPSTILTPMSPPTTSTKFSPSLGGGDNGRFREFSSGSNGSGGSGGSTIDPRQQEQQQATLALIREAEMKAGFGVGTNSSSSAAAGVGGVGSSYRGGGGGVSGSGFGGFTTYHQSREMNGSTSSNINPQQPSSSQPKPIPPIPNEITYSTTTTSPTSSIPIAPKPTTKRKAASSASSSSKPAPPPLTQQPSSSFETKDDILNPSPRKTPSNIPPSPLNSHRPLPPQTRPIISSSRATTSSQPTPSNSKSTSTSTTTAGNRSGSGKPALLSAAQKKANHIASEQKRRAAIKAGYDGLSSVVPSLKAAVEESKNGNGKGKRSESLTGNGGKRRRGSQGGEEEKFDGRQGPRSEAVVLNKTVDHVRTLLANRSSLLERLSAAYEKAEDQGIQIEGGHRVWEDKWSNSLAGGRRENEEEEEEEEGDWSEED